MSKSGSAEIRIFLKILFLIFLVLKLTHVISWSWWAVFAPFWIPCCIFIVLWLFTRIIYYRITSPDERKEDAVKKTLRKLRGY